MELRLESYNLYHPDTLAVYLQAKLTNLDVDILPPSYKTVAVDTLTKITGKSTKSAPLRNFNSKNSIKKFGEIKEDSYANSVDAVF